MKNYRYTLLILAFVVMQTVTAQTKNLEPFNSVVISPHISATFVEGNKESITINDIQVSEDKVNIEVKGEKLYVYLDDAKNLTKHEKVKKEGVKMKVPIYKKVVLNVTITYKSLDKMVVKGEQSITCKSKITTDDFRLTVYGEPELLFEAIEAEEFITTMHGAGSLKVKKGTTNYQKITAYGEGVFDLSEIDNKESRLVAYGEAEFYLQSSDRIKITAYGEASLSYKGDAEVKRGINIGGVDITKVD